MAEQKKEKGLSVLVILDVLSWRGKRRDGVNIKTLAPLETRDFH